LICRTWWQRLSTTQATANCGNRIVGVVIKLVFLLGSGHSKAAKQSPVAVTDPVLPAPVTPAVAPDDPSGRGNGHGHAYGRDKA